MCRAENIADQHKEGAAVRDHFKYAAQCGLDIVFTLDGNGQRNR